MPGEWNGSFTEFCLHLKVVHIVLMVHMENSGLVCQFLLLIKLWMEVGFLRLSLLS